MGYNSQTKVILVNLIKSSLSRHGQFGPNLVQKYATFSHDSLSEDLFEVLWHDEALEKRNLSYFSKKFPFWAIQAYLAQYYTTNCARDFQKHSSMMCVITIIPHYARMFLKISTAVTHQSYLSIFQKNSFFRPVAVQAKTVPLIHMIYPVAIFMK